jgi:hypothetical protein
VKKINLSNLTIKELLQLQNEVACAINNYKDGYLYICRIRQYGNIYEEYCYSKEATQTLCDEYNGENGIVDVYTTNPNLKFPELALDNYGDTFYIQGDFEYKEWLNWQKHMTYLLNCEEEWKKFNEYNENYSYSKTSWSRYGSKPPQPYSTQEKNIELRKKLELQEKTIIKPIPLSPSENDDI